MKRKCPDCGKTEVSNKKDREQKKEVAKELEISKTVCWGCINFYDSVEREQLSDHYRGN